MAPSGSRVLFNDQELIPAKGQLTVLLPQGNVDYPVLAENNLYVFPRRDGILLGGTFEHENWSLERIGMPRSASRTGTPACSAGCDHN